MAIYALEDVDTFTFRVFGRLLVSFQGITPDRDFLKNWGATEFEDSTAKGVAFLGRLGTESAKANGQKWPLELTIADATADPEEPFIEQVDEKNLAITDRQLREDLSRDYNIVEWRGSNLRPNKCGIKTLVTSYSHYLDGHVHDVYAVRQKLLVEKLVMLTVVDVDEAMHLRGPLNSVLRRIVLS